MKHIEDVHFYIDNTSPSEVTAVFSTLPIEGGLTPNEIAENLQEQLGVQMQRDKTYAPRRLYDLGLAEQLKQGGKVLYILSPKGAYIRNLGATRPSLLPDVIHYLHFSGFYGIASDRKYLWSYRQCCNLVWRDQVVRSTRELAVWVQERMQEQFPQYDQTSAQGVRFDARGAQNVLAWVKALIPSPVGKPGAPITKRQTAVFELALLALDDAYRFHGYKYGDPIMLDDALIWQLAGVFFLDIECCRDLLRLADRLSEAITITPTLAGPAVVLKRPYRVDDI